MPERSEGSNGVATVTETRTARFEVHLCLRHWRRHVLGEELLG